jgi:hypothetical protein
MPTITSIPFTVSTPGRWYLASHFDASVLPLNPATGLQVPAIELGCDGIEIVGNGYMLINSAGPDNRGVGVYGLNRSRCRIEGLTIFGKGFWYPVYLENTDGYGSGQNKVIGNCLSSSFRGARIEGQANLISGNRVFDVGGQTSAPGGFSMGLEVFGHGSTIKDNDIHKVYSLGGNESVGICLSHFGRGAVIAGNKLTNQDAVPVAIGVWVGDGCYDVLIRENVISRWNRGIFTAASAPDEVTNNGTSGVMRSNEIIGCAIPVQSNTYWLVDGIPGVP